MQRRSSRHFKPDPPKQNIVLEDRESEAGDGEVNKMLSQFSIKSLDEAADAEAQLEREKLK